MADKLRVICFKLDAPQLEQMDELIREQLYFSRSEILRSAIRHMVQKVSADPSYRHLGLLWSRHEESFALQSEVTNQSVSSKLPPILLKCVDEVVSKGIFESRSHLIRESVRCFLHDRQNLHALIQESAG